MLHGTMARRPSAALAPAANGGFSLSRTIGLRIGKLRQQHGWTLKEMAAKLQVSLSMYSKYEYGANPPPIDKTIALAEIFGVSLDFLLTGNQTEGRPIHHTRLLERFQAIESLPSEDIEAAITVLDGLVVRREVAQSVARRVQPVAR